MQIFKVLLEKVPEPVIKHDLDQHTESLLLWHLKKKTKRLSDPDDTDLRWGYKLSQIFEPKMYFIYCLNMKNNSLKCYYFCMKASKNIVQRHCSFTRWQCWHVPAWTAGILKKSHSGLVDEHMNTDILYIIYTFKMSVSHRSQLPSEIFLKLHLCSNSTWYLLSPTPNIQVQDIQNKPEQSSSIAECQKDTDVKWKQNSPS